MRIAPLVAILAVLVFAGPAVPQVTGFHAVEKMDLGAHHLDAADFNGDGKTDFLTVTHPEGRVMIHLNRGGGVWEPYVAATFPASFRAIRIGDLNGDGALDLFAYASLPSVGGGATTPVQVVMLNDGKGFFSFEVTGFDDDPSDLSLVDIDGDGDLDVALVPPHGSEPDGLDFLLNDGTGRFTLAGDRVVTPSFNRFTFGDANEDGLPDLLLSSSSSTGLYVNLGGTFAPEPQLTVGGRDAGLRDVDGDGHLDLLLAKRYVNNEMYARWGNGDGTFSEPTVIADAWTGPTYALTWAWQTVDIDDDGDLDLLNPGMWSFATIVENLDGRTFGPPKFYRFSEHGTASRIAWAGAEDYDGDGDREVCFHNDRTTLYFLRPDDTPPPTITSMTPSEGDLGQTVPVVIEGTGFDPGTTVRFTGAKDLVLLDYEIIDSGRIEATLRLPGEDDDDPTSQKGFGWSLHVESGAGALASHPSAMWVESRWDGSVKFRKARLDDNPEPGGDRFRFRGGVGGNSMRVLTDRPGEDLTIAFGHPDSPYEIHIPGDSPAWKYQSKQVRLRYRSPKGQLPKIRLDFRANGPSKKRGILIDVRGFDLPVGQDGTVRVYIRKGERRVRGTREFAENFPARWRFRE